MNNFLDDLIKSLNCSSMKGQCIIACDQACPNFVDTPEGSLFDAADSKVLMSVASATLRVLVRRLEELSPDRVEVSSASLLDDYVIRTNQDSKIREALVKTGGHCPCQIPQEDGSSYCMCQDFRDKLLDPKFYGSCICGLYTKVKR